MKMHLKTAFAVLAGVGFGIATVHGIHAGQAKAPPAFVISNIAVTDPAKYHQFYRVRPEAEGAPESRSVMSRSGVAGFN